MDKSTSIYLDAIRFLAAFVVFAFHLQELDAVELEWKITFAREAVMVFFVLSGFVIAYVANKKEKTFDVYIGNRLARLYSVVIPALILTLALDSIGNYFTPSLYNPVTHSQIPERLVVSLLFLNQNWNLTVMPMSNGPFWSICFEFWYYIIFAAAIYIKPLYLKSIMVFLLCVFAGPRILLLLPCWLIGVATYYISINFSKVSLIKSMVHVFAWVLIVGLIIGDLPHEELVREIKASSINGYIQVLGVAFFIGGELNFISDYIFCLIFALTIFTANSFYSNFAEIKPLSKSIRNLACNTFSLYLYHVPLILFFMSIVENTESSALVEIMLVVFVLSSVFYLAKYTEHKKNWYFAKYRSLYEILKNKESVTR